MSNLPSRWAIHRASRPREAQQYAGFDSDGRLAWMEGWTPAKHFETEQLAADFLDNRMSAVGDDAVVVRHTLH